MEIIIIFIIIAIIITVVVVSKKGSKSAKITKKSYSSANVKIVNTAQISEQKPQSTQPLNRTQTKSVSSSQTRVTNSSLISTTRNQSFSAPKIMQVYNEKPNQIPVVENLPKINYVNEVFVNYDAKKWESTSLFYPYVKIPNKETAIKYPVKGKNSRKGIVENSFCKDFLFVYFKDLIYDNLTVFLGATPYEPDIALIDLNKNLFIDIEIDEPYDGVTRNPIHYVEYGKSVDESRNKGFTDRGWLVIRFSEKQVKEQPMQCCKSIYEIVKSITNISISALDNVTTLTKEKMWTKDEAIQMAKDRVREKYLGILQFQQSYTSQDYSIKDYVEGQKIGTKLLPEPKPIISHPIQRTVAATTVSVSQITTKAEVKPTITPKPNVVNPPTPTPRPQEPRISTQPTNQPSTPAPRPYAL